MSVINFLFGSRTPSGFNLSGLIEFDADLTVEENHERSSEVTQHPVELGSTISDHVILNPERLSLEGFVTDAGVAVFGASPGRTQTAFEALDELWKSGEPVTVVTNGGYKNYINMVINRLDMPRTRPGSMRFSIELIHVNIVNSETTEVVAAEDDPETQDRASEETDEGRQATQEAGSSTDSQSSLLYDLTQGLF